MRTLYGPDVIAYSSTPCMGGSVVALFGGYDTTHELFLDDLLLFDMATHSLRPVLRHGDWPSPRCDHKAYSVGTKLVIVGGCGGSASQPLTDSWAFDYETHEWTRIGGIPCTNMGSGCCVVDGAMHMVGGYAEGHAVHVRGTLGPHTQHEGGGAETHTPHRLDCECPCAANRGKEGERKVEREREEPTPCTLGETEAEAEEEGEGNGLHSAEGSSSSHSIHVCEGECRCVSRETSGGEGAGVGRPLSSRHEEREREREARRQRRQQRVRDREAQGRWEELPPAPFQVMTAGVMALEHYVVVFGGMCHEGQVHAYDTIAQEWEAWGGIPAPIGVCTACPLGDDILLHGEHGVSYLVEVDREALLGTDL
ncbi:hypothetical protein KIPB_000029 [Kipferlia bialata]|uniref:Uncharacterized protein n=1 Tax=Kipferlia bialata TaxID=797122 RepID=A0A9K3CMY3_9EUKA|nr:hypothetical protein KIPB_000029 [Kipferlia bialata]|eukprot:g29.t1